MASNLPKFNYSHFCNMENLKIPIEDFTKTNIESAIQQMILFSQNNENAELWFSFSGHGSQKNSFIESDGKTELICPSDYKTNGYISDNWLNSQFCNKLSDSSKLFVLIFSSA